MFDSTNGAATAGSLTEGFGGRNPFRQPLTASPFAAAVERYKRLRSAAMELSHRMIRTIPRECFGEIGKAIGILHKGVLVFQTEDISSVLMDCCLHDWVRDGKNVVQKYAESHAPAPGTDEYEILQAYQKARYRIVLPEACLPGAGMHVVDMLSGEQLFLLDVNLSRNPLARVPLATRTVPFEWYWITGGAPLVMDQRSLRLTLKRLDMKKVLVRGAMADVHRMALLIVQACLESGAAEHVRYEDPGSPGPHPGSEGHQPRPASRAPGRNEPCPCGSGKKYKKCCGAMGRN